MPSEKTKVSSLLLPLSLWKPCVLHTRQLFFLVRGQVMGEAEQGEENRSWKGGPVRKVASNSPWCRNEFSAGGHVQGEGRSDPLASDCSLFCFPCVKCSNPTCC